MPAEQIYIIDESLSQDDSSAYNPMLDASINMEDFIEIKERKLPGKKPSFNNIADASTKEVVVTGLVLHFSQDVSDSRLKSVIRRTDMEFLYLYADTIIVNDKLSFPQTNVSIICRHLIIEKNGTLSTTPENNAQLFAVGTGGDTRKAGATGEPAGKVTLLCNTIENKHTENGPVFFLNGAKGQNGEMGGLKQVKIDKGYPVHWDDIRKKIIENDTFVGNYGSWAWPETSDTDKIYFAKILSNNLTYGPNSGRRYYKTTHGDENKQNQDNGADAIASGIGGNGGIGGNISYLEFKKEGRNPDWDLGGGEPGTSTRIEGGKKAKDSTYYHIEISAWHKDPNWEWNDKKNRQPHYWKLRTLTSHDGNPAKNSDGQKGANGTSEKLPADKYSWLHPILMETMLQFAKTAFRDGERRRAKWILEKYNEAIKTLPAALKEEMRTAALVREVDLYLSRLAKNLDFYGYPPGWIPRLSVLSNLKVIKDSRRDLAQLLFFANRLLNASEKSKSKAADLEWTIKELNKGLKNAQADISAAFEELPQVQGKISEVEGQIRVQLDELSKLKKKIHDEVEEKSKEQALFTGSMKILGGICALVPVGQPYVGQLGGDIFERVSKIDIDSKKPLGEVLTFAGGFAEDVGSFYEKNEAKLKADLTSELSGEIKKGTKDLNKFSDDITSTKADLKDAEKALKETFKDQEISLMRDKMKVIRNINTGGSGSFSSAEDYADIISYMDELQQSITNARDITETQKQELNKKLGQLKTDKKDLTTKLKASKAAKAKREGSIETAGKVIKGFTQGISGIAGGIQAMMVEFDENDPKVQEKMAAIMASVYSKEFDTINKKVAEINKQKLPLTERLMYLEQKISDGVQRINNNLVQWSVLNDELVNEVQTDLLPATTLYLKGIVQQSWDLLMQECYYLTKSYQYRFIKKIDPIQHGIKELLKDIENFSKGQDPASMKEDEYKKLFDTVLKSQFKRLAFDLLIKLQETSAKITNKVSIPVIDYKKEDGRVILDQLNTFGEANFRLEDIKSSKQGTGSWFHYRIVKISFEDIVVEADDPNVSFDFGIRHSGDSLIRATNKKLYYFTSRSSQKNEGVKLKGIKKVAAAHEIDLQVQSWNASYNGSQLDKVEGPITNETDSGLDQQLLYEFLKEFGLKEEYDARDKPYKDHYPGATSELTLKIYDDSDKFNFNIKKLAFKVEYEVLQ